MRPPPFSFPSLAHKAHPAHLFFRWLRSTKRWKDLEMWMLLPQNRSTMTSQHTFGAGVVFLGERDRDTV